MNLKNINNGSFIREEDVFKIIEEDCIHNHIPIMVFVNITSVQFIRKLILVITQLKKDLEDMTNEEYEIIDKKTNEICDSPLWLNDIIVKSMADYKSAEGTITNEKVKYVFMDVLPDTISKSDVIEWSEEVGFNVYFIKLT